MTLRELNTPPQARAGAPGTRAGAPSRTPGKTPLKSPSSTGILSPNDDAYEKGASRAARAAAEKRRCVARRPRGRAGPPPIHMAVLSVFVEEGRPDDPRAEVGGVGNRASGDAPVRTRSLSRRRDRPALVEARAGMALGPPRF